MRVRWTSGPLDGTEVDLPYAVGHLAALEGRAVVLDSLLEQRAEAATMFVDGFIAATRPTSVPTPEDTAQPPAPERAVRDHRGRPRGGRR